MTNDPQKREAIAKSTIKKKTFTDGLKDIVKERSDSIIAYIVADIVIPTVKSTISDIVQGGIERLLYGDNKPTNKYNNYANKSYVSYNKYSSQPIYNRPRSQRRNSGMELIFDSRAEAQDVLAHMIDAIQEYGRVSVADLFDLAGQDSDFTDHHYGWTDLHSARVVNTREGYKLDLPEEGSIK